MFSFNGFDHLRFRFSVVVVPKLNKKRFINIFLTVFLSGDVSDPFRQFS